MYLRKRNFVNILLISGFFFYINYSKSTVFKQENTYLVKLNIMTVAEIKLPESRLLIDKKFKKNQDKQELEIKKIKQEQELETKKTTKKNKIENTSIKVTIKYLPNKSKPENNELIILKDAITKLSNINSLTIKGYAEKRLGDSSSKVRRLSLKRALFLRELFLKNNFQSTKIYVRAMGYDSNIKGNKDIVIISSESNK